jgi:heme-degrading monooxygenase HmoA
MGTSPPQLRRVPGLRFFKLLGSGGTDGFGLNPNWDRYALLATWDSPQAAAAFEASALWADYQRRSQEQLRLELLPIRAHGLWDGQQPFEVPAGGAGPAAGALPPAGPVGVLTRASIHLRKARRFWSYAGPGAAPLRALAEAPGVRLAIGLGELPVVRQATFSLWDSEQAVQDYAYRDVRHREVIQLTRAENWYSEEMFARFRVLRGSGTVDGRNPLEVSA